MTQPTDLNKGKGALSSIYSATQQFISDVLTEKPTNICRMDDYPQMRKNLFENVKNAVERRFPLRNNRFSLGVEDVDYDDPEDLDVDVQKQLLLQGKSSTRRLRGSWVLRDVENNKELSRTRRMTLMRVPRLTDRGTFIKNGKDYAFSSIMRLEPGVYVKNKSDEVVAQFNIKSGTGSGFNMALNPKSGVFTMRRGTLNAPAYTVLHDFGVSDDAMAEAWGQELFETNKKAGTGEKAKIAANRIYN